MTVGRSRLKAGRLGGLSLCGVLLLAGCGDDTVTPESSCTPTGGLVTRILDGDTVELETGKKVRYLLVDTPEVSKCNANDTEACWQSAAGKHECFANEARELNRRLVQYQEIEIHYDLNQCTDLYERVLGYVYVDGRMVNRILVERGYARVMIMKPESHPEDYEYQAELLRLEETAQEEKRGLWGVCP